MLRRFSWKIVAIVYCHSDCFSQQPWEITKEDMKTFFQDNGIEVSYEAKMPLEHQESNFLKVLDEIKTKARSKYSRISFKLINVLKVAP